MAFWKDKKGKKVGFKEFFTRFKNGIQSITPYQQTKWIMIGSIMIIIGIVWGIIYSVIGKYWWLSTILAGALLINALGILTTWQKLKILKQTDEFMKTIESENKQKIDYVQ